MQDLIDKAVEMGHGEEEVWKNMEADINNKINQSIIPNFCGMDASFKQHTEEMIEDSNNLSEHVGGLTGKVQSLRDEIARLESKSITIETHFIQTHSTHYNKESGGLILKAQEGFPAISGSSNAVPVLLHPPELVLNPEQAIRTLWHIANKPIDMATPSGNALPENLLIHNVIEMDREVLAEQINKINIDKDVVRV